MFSVLLIIIVFLFNSKLHNTTERIKRAWELANKTDNRTVSYKHHTGRVSVQIK